MGARFHPSQCPYMLPVGLLDQDNFTTSSIINLCRNESVVTSRNAWSQHRLIISSSSREWDRLTSSSSVVYIGFNGIKEWKNNYEAVVMGSWLWIHFSGVPNSFCSVEFNLHFLQHITVWGWVGGWIQRFFLNTRHWDTGTPRPSLGSPHHVVPGAVCSSGRLLLTLDELGLRPQLGDNGTVQMNGSTGTHTHKAGR